jgi:hypothetical protein
MKLVGEGHSQNVGLNSIVLSPFFWECPTWGFTLQKKNLAYGTYGGGGAKQFAIFHELF